MDHIYDLMENSNRDHTLGPGSMRYTPPEPTENRTILGFDGTDGTHLAVIQARFTADPTQALAVFASIGTSFATIQAAFSRFTKSVAVILAQLDHDAPRRPSALNANYTRRYRNRQGRR